MQQPSAQESQRHHQRGEEVEAFGGEGPFIAFLKFDESDLLVGRRLDRARPVGDLDAVERIAPGLVELEAPLAAERGGLPPTTESVYEDEKVTKAFPFADQAKPPAEQTFTLDPEQVQSVVHRVAACVQRRGRPQVRRVMAEARAEAANPFESTLRAIALDVPGLRVQPQVLIRTGSAWIRPDLLDRELRLVLEADGLEECHCCSEIRMRVSLHLDFALLTRGSDPEAAPEAARFRVPLGAFASRAHDLNRGFLQRSVEHANLCHQDELRRAIATRTDTRLGEVLGVQLADLRADGVELQWVDTTGAHHACLDFGTAATTTHELGELLRDELHSGLC